MLGPSSERPNVRTASRHSADKPANRSIRVAGFGVGLAICWLVFSAATSVASAAPQVTPSPVENSTARVLPAQDLADGAAVYSANCASCHQANAKGLPGTFPPLAGNPNVADASYVEEVVKNGLSGPIEVLGETYDSQMPPFAALSDDEVAAVTAYVVSLSGQSEEPDDGEAEEAQELVAVGDVAEGRELFVGSDRLDGGGASCAGCHSAGSVGRLGSFGLGPDLTEVAGTLGGEAGLAAWLTNPPSQVMAPIFTDHPITEEEVADIAAFLADAPSQSKPSSLGDGLLLFGLVGTLLLLAGMAVIWRGMRMTYVERLRSRS